MLAFRLLEVRNGSSVWDFPSLGERRSHGKKVRLRFRLTAPYSEERRRAASEAAKKHSGNLTHTIQKDVV
jgi:hypothetical protein